MKGNGFDIAIDNLSGSMMLTIEPKEAVEINDFCCEMIKKTNVLGLLKLNVTTIDGKIKFNYDLSKKRSIAEFAKTGFNESYGKRILYNLCNAFLKLNEYYLKPNFCLLDPEYTYVGDGLNVYLAYLPIKGNNNDSTELKEYFSELLSKYFAVEGVAAYDEMFKYVYQCQTLDLAHFISRFLSSEVQNSNNFVARKEEAAANKMPLPGNNQGRPGMPPQGARPTGQNPPPMQGKMQSSGSIRKPAGAKMPGPGAKMPGAPGMKMPGGPAPMPGGSGMKIPGGGNVPMPGGGGMKIPGGGNVPMPGAPGMKMPGGPAPMPGGKPMPGGRPMPGGMPGPGAKGPGAVPPRMAPGGMPNMGRPAPQQFPPQQNNPPRFAGGFQGSMDKTIMIDDPNPQMPKQSQPPQQAGRTAYLQYRGQNIPINSNEFTIGKANNQYKVNFAINNNAHVSRKHATILVQGNSYYIRDEGSTNGTFVNGRALPKMVPQPLNNGDEISIYDEVFRFCL